jgi:Arc/MetJ family transcription regulator
MHILMYMRSTLIIDDELLDRARKLSGIDEKTALVRAGLEALVAVESARRLAKLGGTEPDAKVAPRRRSDRSR